MIFSIPPSHCLCDTFSYAFSANICLTLEAVIIAGSVKEDCSGIMPLLRVVAGKMLFRRGIGIFKSCLTVRLHVSTATPEEPSLRVNFPVDSLIDSESENELCDKTDSTLTERRIAFLMTDFTCKNKPKKTPHWTRRRTIFVLKLPLKQDECETQTDH